MLWSNIKRQEMRHFFILILAIIVLQPLNAQSLYFPPVTGSTWDTISPKTLGYCQTNIDRLYEYLEANNTRAFILLKNGKIVLEKYFGTHTQLSPWQWERWHPRGRHIHRQQSRAADRRLGEHLRPRGSRRAHGPAAAQAAPAVAPA